MKEGYSFWNGAEVIKQLEESLLQDSLVLGSSDTVFGLLANTTEKGFNALNKIKGRQDKPYIVLIGGVDKLKHFVDCDLSGDVSSLLNFCWPGPLTMIFKAKTDLPNFLKSNDGKIALRVPQHDGLLELLKRFDGLFSTSANLSGENVPGFVENINQSIIENAGMIVLDEYSTGYANASKPSTILDCSTPENIYLIRAGAYSIDSLERICDNPIVVY